MYFLQSPNAFSNYFFLIFPPCDPGMFLRQLYYRIVSQWLESAFKGKKRGFGGNRRRYHNDYRSRFEEHFEIWYKPTVSG